MSCRQVINSMLVYFSLTRTSYLVTGQVKILMYLPGGQVKIFRFFYPCTSIYLSIHLSIPPFIHKTRNILHAKLVDDMFLFQCTFLDICFTPVQKLNAQVCLLVNTLVCLLVVC